MSPNVKVTLTIRQAEALLQLAQEADVETFASCGMDEKQASIMIEAGDAAVAKLATAIGQAERKRDHARKRSTAAA